MYDQIYAYFNNAYFSNIFLKIQSRFRKGYKAQYCLKSMTEKLRKVLGAGGHAGALFADLSKIFNCTGSRFINC